MNIDFNIFDFIDVIYIVLIPVAIMVWMTFWLRRQQRSQKMIRSIWGGFVCIVIVGLTCLLIGIQSTRIQWLNYFAEMAAAYSVVVSKLEHWKIISGNEDIFSDWSDPITPISSSEKQDVPKPDSLPPDTSATENPKEKLAVPEFISAVRTSLNHVSLRWLPVPGATTYRIQWGKLDESWEEDDWEAVYSGAVCECVIESPDNDHVYRVRAETGTPEDDPTYLALLDACESAEKSSRFIAAVYTMRAIDEESSMFIICPAADFNENGIIEPNERAAPIGEPYPNTAVMAHVFAHQVPAINTIPVRDEWGVWVTAFHPILDPEGNFDGAIGLDFDYSLWSGMLAKAKIWPYSFFFILTLLFFGSTYLIVLNQRSRESSEHFAAQLQDSVVQLTEAKVAAEAGMRAKGHFLANMSHEIRTPMNVVLGFANIIGQKLMERCLPEERKKCRESIDLMTSSGNDLLTIINDILDFTKVESDQIEVESIPVSLEEIIESVRLTARERLIKNANLMLEFKNDGGVPQCILSDPTRLRQILNNLIGNAIKFTESGTVAVRYGMTQKKMLFVEVRDTGIGMTADQLSRLFQPFSQADTSLTRRFGGTGLGLSISKRLAILLGGDICVASVEGEGSVFTLVLPIREPCAEDIQNHDVKRQKNLEDHASMSTKMIELIKTKPLSGLNVLVVEDARVNQIVISAQLTEAGATVSLAGNGQIAIETINAKESADLPFDVVLMDMQMPVMDGYEATKHLRSDGYARPIIAITAHALSGDCEKTLAVGCDAYLSKPINGNQLISMILQMCRKGK